MAKRNNVGQVYYRVFNNITNEYDSSTNVFFGVNLVEGKQIVKLGIQAPAGTVVVLNDNKNIVIGRSGIYELNDDDIIITSVVFPIVQESKNLNNIVVDYIY